MIKYPKEKRNNMNSIGIVCEYKPFHNGHLYQIKKIKEIYPDSILIGVISSVFTQRGDICIINKFQVIIF